MTKKDIEHALLKANGYAQLPLPSEEKWLTQSIVDEVYKLWLQSQQSGMTGFIRMDKQIPPVGIYCATYNGDHVILQVHDGGFRIVFYDGKMEDVPRINLIKWLDESDHTSELEKLREEILETLKAMLATHFDSELSYPVEQIQSLILKIESNGK